MCEPTTLLSIASSAVGYIMQSEQADRQAEAEERTYNAQMRQVAEQQKQINQQATDEETLRMREARVELGRMRTMGAESGLAGINAGRLEGEVEFNAGSDVSTISANRTARQNQLTAEAEGLRAGSSARLASIKQPSLIGTGLQIAGAYVNGETRTQANRTVTRS